MTHAILTAFEIYIAMGVFIVILCASRGLYDEDLGLWSSLTLDLLLWPMWVFEGLLQAIDSAKERRQG